MVDSFLSITTSLIKEIGSIEVEVAFTLLFGLPILLFFATIIVCAFSEKVRKASKKYFDIIGSIFMLLVVAYGMCEIVTATRFARLNIYYVVLFAVLNRILTLVMYVILKQTKKCRTYFEYNGGQTLNNFDNFLSAKNSMNFPLYNNEYKKGKTDKILPQNNELYLDIKLEHTFGMISQLKEKDLSIFDRQEVENIEETLFKLNGKRNYSVDEATLLNDDLSSLLKMMAKYEVNSLAY